MKQLHPSTAAVIQYFESSHLRAPRLRSISQRCADLATVMAYEMEGPELTAGLRKLLEAKDCFVRAALGDKVKPGVPVGITPPAVPLGEPAGHAHQANYTAPVQISLTQPPGCICSYTWGLDGQLVRNGALSTCPADHGAIDAGAAQG